MKGVVFTEFLQLVEEKFGYEMVDSVLLKACPANHGAYTSVGTYDCQELIDMVVALSEKVDIATPELVKAFGKYLFGKFTSGYSEQISGFTTSFELLEKVEDYIHVEVRKLYPGAELPTFSYQRPDENTLVMTYQSNRPFADLCEGLIEECIVHFKEDVLLHRENLNEDGTAAQFTMTRQSTMTEPAQVG